VHRSLRPCFLVLFFLLTLTAKLPAFLSVGNLESPDPPPNYRVGHLDSETESDSYIWPLFRFYTSEDTNQYSMLPIFSYRKEKEEAREDTTHVIWPFFKQRYREKHWTSNERKEFSFWPLYHTVWEHDEKYGKIWHRYLFPLYFAGKQPQNNGRYFILFPFIWYADNAILVAPLFPKRPQTFAAIWPLVGHFKNYWNRDRITFLFWPLFIKSSEGKPDERIDVYSMPWPFLGYYHSKVMNGFYVWPLFSRVNKPNDYTRAYWLWPLGHYRSEVVDEDDRYRDQVKGDRWWLFWFFPFYGKADLGLFDYLNIFPFYGEVDMNGRRVRGYFFAMYNRDENFRQGIATNRILWFMFKWTNEIPIKEEFADPPPERPKRSGIIFIYKKTKTETKLRLRALLTLYQLKIDRFVDEIFTRQYFLPFYGRQTREFPQEDVKMTTKYIFPFYREVSFNQTHQYQSAPHLFFYTSIDQIDRNIGGIWEIWRKERNPQDGSYSESIFGSLYRHGKDGDGTTHRQVNLGLVKGKWTRGENGKRKGETSLIFGLLKYKWNKSGKDSN